MKESEGAHFKVALEDVQRNPHQPRKQFNEKELEDLARSIQSVGLIHPPTVIKLKEGSGYELVSGERRLRACKMAGLEHIPVFIREYSEELSAQAALIENIQRVDLDPLEVAFALSSLMKTQGITQDQLAKKVGKKRSTIANYLRLLGLDISIRDAISSKEISMGHAKVLMSLNKTPDQQRLLHLIIQKQLTVRQSEHVLKTCFQKKEVEEKQKGKKSPEVQDMEQRLHHLLGRKVELFYQADGSGKLVINYYSLDDFDDLLLHLDPNKEAVL
jgi:ParB family transcriptional regulator, chromosome partitioning protein